MAEGHFCQGDLLDRVGFLPTPAGGAAGGPARARVRAEAFRCQLANEALQAILCLHRGKLDGSLLGQSVQRRGGPPGPEEARLHRSLLDRVDAFLQGVPDTTMHVDAALGWLLGPGAAAAPHPAEKPAGAALSLARRGGPWPAAVEDIALPSGEEPPWRWPTSRWAVRGTSATGRV